MFTSEANFPAIAPAPLSGKLPYCPYQGMQSEIEHIKMNKFYQE
ncbi:MAG: hypothetical protein WCD18_20895 [Thermosynechococcaceae cyanobacterium]